MKIRHGDATVTGDETHKDHWHSWEGVGSRKIQKSGDLPFDQNHHFLRNQEGGEKFCKKEVFGVKKLLVSLMVIVFCLISLAYPITIIDDVGRPVTISAQPQRIVSVAPMTTKFLQYLGFQDKIVGVTNWDDFEAERIGDMVPLNIEKILSLKPDIVFASGGFQLPEVAKLEEQKLTTVVLNPNTVQQILNDLVLVGTVLNKAAEARKLASQLENSYVSVAKKAYTIPLENRVKVVYLLDVPGPEIRDIWTCGQGSYLNDIITLAGGVNIAAPYTGSNGWLTISIEFIVAQNPDVIIVANYIPGAEEQIKDKLRQNSAFKNIKAVKNGRIYVYDGNLLSLAVPQVISFIEKFYNDFYGGK